MVVAAEYEGITDPRRMGIKRLAEDGVVGGRRGYVATREPPGFLDAVEVGPDSQLQPGLAMGDRGKGKAEAGSELVEDAFRVRRELVRSAPGVRFFP